MGDRLTGEESDGQADNLSYGDIFDELFPHYLVMGMTPEQYWDGENSLKPAFRKAYKIRMENEQRLADRNNWYMGQYLISVLQAVPLLVGGLNVKPSTRLPKYPEKPFFEQEDDRKKEITKKQREEEQAKLAMAMFQQAIARFNRNIEKRIERENTGQSGQ